MNNLSFKLDTLPSVLILSTVFFAPIALLLFSNSLYPVELTAKTTFFGTLVPVLVALVGIHYLFFKKTINLNTPLFLNSYLFFFAWVFSVSLALYPEQNMVFSSLFRQNGILSILMFFTFAYVVSNFLTKQTNRIIFVSSICIATSILIIHALIASSFSGRAPSLVGNALHFGTLCAMTFYCWTYLYSTKFWAIKHNLFFYLLFISGLALCTAGVVASGSRGPLLALLTSGLLTLLAHAYFSHTYLLSNIKKPSLKIVKALAATVLITLSLALLYNSNLYQRTISSTTESGTIAHRLANWNIAWGKSLDRPVTGWGLGSYRESYITSYKKENLDGAETWFDRPHNTYLYWLYSGGFTALALFIIFLSYVFKAILSSSTTLNTGQQIALVGFFTTYVVSILFSFDTFATYFILFSMLGTLGAHLKSNRRIEVPQRDLPKVLAISAVFFLLVSVWFFGVYKPYVATKLFTLSFHDTSEVSFFKQSVQTQGPYNIDYAYIYSNSSDELFTPSAVSKLNSTQALLLAQMIIIWREHIEKNPNSIYGHYYYSQNLLLAGFEKEAYLSLARVIDKAPEHPAIRRLWTHLEQLNSPTSSLLLK